MKTCSRCGDEKPLSEYFVKDKKSGRLHAQCKDCYKEYRKTYHRAHYLKYHAAYLERASSRRQKLRDEFHTNMLNFLSLQSCIDCGENDIRVLELDHRSADDKLFNISQAVKLGYSWDMVISEIEKCDVRCANCHKRRTAAQFQWYKA